MACNCNTDTIVLLRTLWPVLSMIRPKNGIKKLEKEMTRLRAKRDDIKIKIDVGRCEEKIPTNEVNQWLTEVEELEGKVAVIKHDLESIKREKKKCNCFHRTGGTSSQTQQEEDITPGKSSHYCSIFIRMVKKLYEAKKLKSQAGKLDPIVISGLPQHTAMLSFPQRPPLGIEPYVNDIVDYIDGGEGKIVGIYGMGGVGKSIILSSIERHYKDQNIFDHVIPVPIKAFKGTQLKAQIAIAGHLNLKTEENDNENTYREKLKRHLEDKNCLLLLDGIWESLDLGKLGMTTEQGQKQQRRKVVVLTTRSKTICVQMRAEKKIKVECLDPDRAIQLFEQNCDGDVLRSNDGIKFFARKLANECAGLPLALVTVARAMSRTESLDVWKDALHKIKDKHDWTTIGLPHEDLVKIHNVFKLSYDNLDNDDLRECLMCCALWPEGYEIRKFDDLIPCWIGCGIIRKFNAINNAFTEGYSHLEALMAASLLEHSSIQRYHFEEKHVKMHKVIRDMALSDSEWEGNERKWIVKAGNRLNHLSIQEEWQEVERASFMKNNITSLQECGAFTFPKLSMLILLENSNLKTIPPSLFTSMPHLTYLDLTLCGITELPSEIGRLTQLLYINLSRNPITTLPAEFGCLSKLEYLLLRDTNLVTIPDGMISNLSKLKWLDIKGIYPMPEWWWDELKCFKGRHQLSVAIDISATTANIERLTQLPNVSIWDLTIDGDNASELPDLNLSTQQWSYNISDNLESLHIKNVEVGKLMLASGVGHESSFMSLKKLSFYNLQLLEEISLNGVKLYCLRELNISNCPNLKNISWVLQLPSLSVLMIEICSEMKELIRDAGKSDSKFSIRSLTLLNMSNLNCIANHRVCFPNLEYIHVVNCPELKKLSFADEILKSKLKEIRCDEAWWRNLDWDYKSQENSFEPHFIPKS